MMSDSRVSQDSRSWKDALAQWTSLGWAEKRKVNVKDVLKSKHFTVVLLLVHQAMGYSEVPPYCFDL